MDDVDSLFRYAIRETPDANWFLIVQKVTDKRWCKCGRCRINLCQHARREAECQWMFRRPKKTGDNWIVLMIWYLYYTPSGRNSRSANGCSDSQRTAMTIWCHGRMLIAVQYTNRGNTWFKWVFDSQRTRWRCAWTMLMLCRYQQGKTPDSKWMLQIAKGRDAMVYCWYW